MSSITIAFIALIVVIFLMALTWVWAVKIDNYGIVDATWSYCFLIHGLLFLILADGYVYRQLLALTLLGLWSLRLGTFLTKRLYSHHPHEDTRYQKLRADYGSHVKRGFLVFYFYQAISVSVLTLPFILIFQNIDSPINNWEIAGAILWVIALVGESIADHQMNSFKSHKENKGKICNVGLWNYSRHPNYFFESLIWWGYFLVMIGSGVYWGIYAPLIILFLLLKVTGVPPSEEQSLKSRGDAYRAYQKKTSVFVPWFKKES